jgi:1-acyl-sn-glycerol-3-phosphate acyltransferase
MTTIEDTPANVTVDFWRTRTHGRDLETDGLTHLPKQGGAVLALTHFASRELALVELAIWRHSRRRIHCLVLNGHVEEPDAGGLFRPVRRIFVDLTAGVPAYARAVDALWRGELVALFPETGGDASPAVREFRVGAARLAVEAEVPLVPVVVWGDPTGNPGVRWPHRASRTPTRVSFGAPIPMQRFEDVRAVTDELRATMQRMTLEFLTAR